MTRTAATRLRALQRAHADPLVRAIVYERGGSSKPHPRMGLADFVREAWPHVEPKGCVWGSHIDYLCEALERVSMGEIKRLAINIPPGSSKSLLVNVFWPAWEWAMGHRSRFLCAAGVQGLAIRDAIKCRKLIDSEWYTSRWHVPIRRDANAKTYFELEQGGSRRALSKSSRTTGHRGDRLITDDLTTVTEVYSPARLERAKEWFNTEFLSRTDAEDTPVVVIGQRLHEADIFADLREQGGWVFIVLPSEYDPELAASAHTYDRPDWRRERGELLHPERTTALALARSAREMGRLNYLAQHGQRPSALDGGVVRRDDFRRYRVAPPIASLDELALSVDATFEGEDGSDRVSLQMWGRQGMNAYLLDEVVAVMSFTETLAAIRGLLARPLYARATLLIEKKANGHALINVLRATFPNVVAVIPRDSKTARLVSCTPAIEAGQVWIPDPRWWTWAEDVLNEWCAYPRGRYDDRVDTLTQVLIRWFGRRRAGADAPRGAGPRLE